MNPRLFEAIAGNDIQTFLRMVRNNEGLRSDTLTDESKDSLLHIAARFGHVELVTEIIQRFPDLVSAKNISEETPLHEACRQGNVDVVILLLDANPWIACTKNTEKHTPCFTACSYGHVDVVNYFSNHFPRVLDFEDGVLSPLHVSVSLGHYDIVRIILDTRPNLAAKVDKDGFLPLHLACQRGHLEIARMLLQLDQYSALKYSKDGYTAAHIAAMNGHVQLLEEFLLRSPISFSILTLEGDSVFHLAVRFNRYDAFTYLANIFYGTDLFSYPDKHGNTVLHLAVSTRRYKLAEYSIEETLVDINGKNVRDQTAYDILNRQCHSLGQTTDGTHDTNWNSDIQHLKEVMTSRHAKTSQELLRMPLEADVQQSDRVTEDAATVVHDQPTEESMIRVEAKDHSNRKVAVDNLFGTPFESKRPVMLEQSDLELEKVEKGISSISEYEIYREALQNTRNTITLVAILIASVTYTSGINPPGGVYQEGWRKGQSTIGRTTAFKVFAISNTAALFVSMLIVIVLVSIIPFRRKPLMKLLVVAHKVMWVAVSLMATAYISAAWVIIPHGEGTNWTLGALLAVAAGAMGSVFLFLGVTFTRHQLMKSKWRKQRGIIEDQREKSGAARLVEEREASGVVVNNVQRALVPEEGVLVSGLTEQDKRQLAEIAERRAETKREKAEKLAKRLARNETKERDGSVWSFSTNSDAGSSKSLGYHTF